MSANSPTPFTGPHLLIPFAVASAEAWLHTVKSMPPANTRNLAQLLKGMKPVDESLGEVKSLTPPHERFLAQSLGLANPDTPDGLMPWAAQDALALDAVTHGGARVCGFADHGLEVGCRADLVLVEAENLAEAVVARPPRQLVVSAGRIVARNGAQQAAHPAWPASYDYP